MFQPLFIWQMVISELILVICSTIKPLNRVKTWTLCHLMFSHIKYTHNFTSLVSQYTTKILARYEKIEKNHLGLVFEKWLDLTHWLS